MTDTYNKLKDPTCEEPAIVELRRLHEAVDRAVLEAYGWSDITVPSYGTPVTGAEKEALQAFEDEIIDRLFVLNAERAEEERLAGTAKKGTKAGRARKKAAPTEQSEMDLD